MTVRVTSERRRVMANAKSGDTVKVNYTGKLEDGSIFDSSEGKDPLEFTLGEGAIIPSFEAAVVGMKVGEKKTVAISSGPDSTSILGTELLAIIS